MKAVTDLVSENPILTTAAVVGGLLALGFLFKGHYRKVTVSSAGIEASNASNASNLQEISGIKSRAGGEVTITQENDRDNKRNKQKIDNVDSHDSVINITQGKNTAR